MRTVARHCSLVAAVLLSACSPALDKQAATEEELPADGKLDSFQKPTDHGAIAIGATATGKLTASERHHTWDFMLSGDAELELTTGPLTTAGREVDTVLYLYKQKEDGRWGAYIARNDDHDDSLWSELTRSLDAGHYRLLVKGYATKTRGEFAVTVGCTGAGCTSAPAATCLLGSTYRELRDHPAFDTLRSERLTSAASLDPIEREQLVVAMHEATHDDVTAAEQAFERADGGQIFLTELQHPGTGVQLLAFEFGLGDTSVGAVFYHHTLDLAASIQDGELTECSFVPATTNMQAGELCRARDACATGLSCLGLTGGRGVCVPTLDLAGDGSSCSLDQPCPGAQLTCAGLSRGDEGLCLPEWLGRSFTELGPFALPTGGLTRHMTAYGLATVDMDVSLSVTITHPDVSRLRVTLQNPHGSEVVVYDGGATGTELSLDGPLLGFSGDESVNGAWTLRVQDTTGAQAGTLAGWHLYVMSRWD
jgi:hypothetical protein